MELVAERLGSCRGIIERLPAVSLVECMLIQHPGGVRRFTLPAKSFVGAIFNDRTAHWRVKDTVLDLGIQFSSDWLGEPLVSRAGLRQFVHEVPTYHRQSSYSERIVVVADLQAAVSRIRVPHLKLRSRKSLGVGLEHPLLGGR